MLIVTSLYLLALITWLGSVIFFSFIGAPSLFKALSPEYAGKAVGAIFTKYFQVGAVCGGGAFVCLLISSFKTGSWPVIKMLILLVMLTLTISNALVTHPKTRALREEIYSSTGKTDLTHLRSEFSRAHRVSALNNGAVLILGLCLVIATAGKLVL